MSKFSSMPIEMIPQYIADLSNSTYVPTTKEEILAMDYFELKILMATNMSFYNAAIALLDEEVNAMIDIARPWSRKLKKARNLEDVLNAKYFGKNYEDSRCEFASIFVEHLWDL